MAKNRKMNIIQYHRNQLHDIAMNLESIMVDKGLDVKTTCEITGVSQRTLMKLLNPPRVGLYTPSLLTLNRLAFGLNVSIEKLIL